VSDALPVSVIVRDEDLLGPGNEQVVNVDRVSRGVDRDRADPLIDRLSYVQDEQQSWHAEIKSSPFMSLLPERLAKAELCSAGERGRRRHAHAPETRVRLEATVEFFRNLDWILGDGQTDDTWNAEFECFNSFYQSLRELCRSFGIGMPPYVSAPYLALRQKLDRRSG